MTSERQVPGAGEIFLDHIGWFVPDMASAADSFARLGFPLTPYTEHRNANPDGTFAAAGTANRCAMLERGYLELLTAIPGADTALARQLRNGLSRYAGVHLVAMTTGDTESERTRLLEAGFDPGDVVHLRRAVAMGDGAEQTSAFSVVRIPPERMPEGRIQFLEQKTPELVWQSQWIASQNAIEALTGVLIVVADVAEAAGRYSRFTGRAARRATERVAVVELDRGRIALAAPGEVAGDGADRAPPFMSAVALRSRDLAATRHFLNERRVRLAADEADHLVVDRREAAGAELVIHARGSGRRLFAR
jgi:hypothetical protein